MPFAPAQGSTGLRALGLPKTGQGMNPRTLQVLEYPKILERVAARCAFSGGQELALALLPSDDLYTVQRQLEQTAEAVRLLEQKNDVHFGGVRDIRPATDKATRRAMLFAPELLDIKLTLQRARTLRALFLRLEHAFPRLAEIAVNIQPLDHVAAEIGRCISDRGDIVDSASDALARIRGELRAAQERLLSTLDRLVHSAGGRARAHGTGTRGVSPEGRFRRGSTSGDQSDRRRQKLLYLLGTRRI